MSINLVREPKIRDEIKKYIFHKFLSIIIDILHLSLFHLFHDGCKRGLNQTSIIGLVFSILNNLFFVLLDSNFTHYDIDVILLFLNKF